MIVIRIINYDWDALIRVRPASFKAQLGYKMSVAVVDTGGGGCALMRATTATSANVIPRADAVMREALRQLRMASKISTAML